MKKIFLCITVVVSVLLLSCNKTENPVTPVPATTGEVNGVVTHSLTGNSISQVRVFTKNSSHSVTTDVTGAYKLLEVAPGNYTLYAEKTGFYTDTIFVRVDTGRVTIGDFIISPIPPPGGISGSVMDNSSGNPLVGVTVTTLPFVGSTTTDSIGNYFITNMPVGKYDITASKFDFAAKTIKITVYTDSVTIVDFDLKPLYGIIEGVITENDTTNLPIEGAIVYTSPATSSVFTDSLGKYRIINVPELTNATQRYKVTASKSGYTDGTKDVNVIAGKTTQADISLTKKK